MNLFEFFLISFETWKLTYWKDNNYFFLKDLFLKKSWSKIYWIRVKKKSYVAIFSLFGRLIEINNN